MNAQDHKFIETRLAPVEGKPIPGLPDYGHSLKRCPEPDSVGHPKVVILQTNADAPSSGVDRCGPATLSSNVNIGLIRELHKDRQALVRANTSLTLQIKSFCRRLVGGDLVDAANLMAALDGKGAHTLAANAAVRCAPFFAARDEIERSRKQREKEILKLAKALPAFGFVATAPGMGPLSFAMIVGECGDLSNYSGPAKLWKRMGLAVIDGAAQRRVTGIDALRHGFNPSRRAIMWNVGSCIIKCGKGKYRGLYDSRKAYEAEREPGIKKIAAHARAQRYAEKAVLKDLWRYWRAQAGKRISSQSLSGFS